jgi:hypothetical protein
MHTTDQAPQVTGETTALGAAPNGVLLSLFGVPIVKMLTATSIVNGGTDEEHAVLYPSGRVHLASVHAPVRIADPAPVQQLAAAILRTCREQEVTVHGFLTDPGGFLDYWGTTEDHALAYAATEYLQATVTP